MAFKLPWSNFHELNLDWVLEKMKELEEKVDAFIGSAVPSNDPPQMDGTASAGSSVNYARGDHVHPTDTSRASASDLSALDTTVYNNYVELHGDINTVDAKIAFDSAAPAMDGVASPGSSPYQARADHVHPTDTSRASKSEFDTLKATVDAWGGATSPYDGTPAMDGTATPGVLGAYSRGDHTHPHDTSKFDKAGGDVTGPMIVETEHRFIDTSAIGWIRVAQVPRINGTKVTFTIVRKGDTTPSETHTVSFYINKNYGLRFIEEVSEGDVAYINSIRYTSAEAIDIHMDQSAVSSIGIHLQKYAPSKTDQNNIILLTPQFVADAPDGETINSTKTLTNQTMRTVSVSKYGKTWKFERRGDLCMMTAPDDIGQTLAAGDYSITSLPWAGTGISYYSICNDPSGNPGTYLQVNQWGTVTLKTAGINSGSPCAFNGCWVLAL